MWQETTSWPCWLFQGKQQKRRLLSLGVLQLMYYFLSCFSVGLLSALTQFESLMCLHVTSRLKHHRFSILSNKFVMRSQSCQNNITIGRPSLSWQNVSWELYGCVILLLIGGCVCEWVTSRLLDPPLIVYSGSFAGQRAIWAHGEVELFGSACTWNLTGEV